MGKRGEESAGQQVQGEFTWTQIHRCAAWCYPAEFDGGSCTCLGLDACSQRGSCHWLSSWFHPEHLPALRKEPSEKGKQIATGYHMPETQSWTRRFPTDPSKDSVSMETVKPECLQFQATCSSWPCLSKEVRLDDLKRPLPTLWLYGAVSISPWHLKVENIRQSVTHILQKLKWRDP